MGMIVGWGKTHPKCLYQIDHYIKYYEQHAASYLPASPAMPIEKWTLRFISVSSVSSSAFHASSNSSLEGLATSQNRSATRQSRYSKTVTWRDSKKSDLATSPKGEHKGSLSTPSPILMGSALKCSHSYEVMTLQQSAPLRSTSAPYYPSSRGHHNGHNKDEKSLTDRSSGSSNGSGAEQVGHNDASNAHEVERDEIDGNESDFTLGGNDDDSDGDFEYAEEEYAGDGNDSGDFSK
jgi:hypothetical protein